MTVAVRNKITNQTDEARISVALEPPTRRINRYSPEIFNGYEDDEEDEFSYSHHISKRVSHQNKKNLNRKKQQHIPNLGAISPQITDDYWIPVDN